MSISEFVDLVEQCRAAQKLWFGGDKSSATLQRSKELERKVDRSVKEMKAGPSLFGEGSEETR